MSEHLTLAATKRQGAGTQIAKKLRRQGIIPAVVYGGHQDTYPIQVNAVAFRNLLKKSASENVLINLEIEGAKEKTKLALIQSVQHNPLTGMVVHIDFNAVSENEEIHAKVPIEIHGEPVGVKSGGLLEQMIHEMEVHCLPANLPDLIIAEVSSLEIGDALHVKDLKFPDGVTSGIDAEVVVAIVSESRASVSEGADGEGEETIVAKASEKAAD